MHSRFSTSGRMQNCRMPAIHKKCREQQSSIAASSNGWFMNESLTEFRPKRAWVVAAFAFVAGALLNEFVLEVPRWLLLTWCALLLLAAAVWDWSAAKRVRKWLVILGYVTCVVASVVYLAFWQKPLTVQSVNIGSFSRNPPAEAEALGIDVDLSFWQFPLYASDVFIITNNTNKTVTFQALLKVQLDDREGPIAVLALGDRAGWSPQLKSFYDSRSHTDENFLLSPVTLPAHQAVRGRFVFRILSRDTEWRYWESALEPTASLDGTAFIDIRDFSDGGRLAEPIYLLGKGKEAQTRERRSRSNTSP